MVAKGYKQYCHHNTQWSTPNRKHNLTELSSPPNLLRLRRILSFLQSRHLHHILIYKSMC